MELFRVRGYPYKTSTVSGEFVHCGQGHISNADVQGFY